MSEFVLTHLQETAQIAAAINAADVERMVGLLVTIRERRGRLFFLGVGGGAAHASHAVNDFRKLAGFEAYAPTDNVAELTARTNDEGWDTTFTAWLEQSHLGINDGVFVFSVGGGSREQHISVNIVNALEYAMTIGATILGVVGRDGGFTAHAADECILIPTVNAASITPHTESFQAVIWHLLVSHPALQKTQAKWESIR